MSTPISCGNTLVTGSGAQLVIDYPPHDLSVTWPPVPATSPLDIRSFNEWSYDLPDVPDSDLLTKHYEAILPGDLIRLDPIDMEIRFSSEIAANRVDDRSQFTTAAGTVPIGRQGFIFLYFPGTAPATGQTQDRWYLGGAGFLRRWVMPPMANNQRNMARAQVIFNNKGPSSGDYPTIGGAVADQRPRWYQVPAP